MQNLRSILMYVMIGVLVVSGCLGFEVYCWFYRPMPLQHNESIVFRLDKSSSARTFVGALESQHLIHAGRLFLGLIRLQGLSTRLKAGVYQMKSGESAQQLLARVVNGDVLKESFRMIAGTTQQQISTNLAQAPYLNYQISDWLHAVTSSSKDDQQHDAMHLWKDANIHGKDGNLVLEGLFLADTYQYNAGSDASGLLSQAYLQLRQHLLKAWQHRDPTLPYKSPYELLIVASILEKEAAIADERRLISGIIVNRLKHHMPLQMDPTVIYALGSAYHGKLTHDDLQIDSPYNSYRYLGLPPTPITTVGKNAIDAASQPKMSNYLYFVAKGDGTHVFSETYDQQREAIERYMRKKA